MSLLIPLERVGVLIGKEGSVKSRVEEAFKVKLTIQSETGLVEITPSEGSDDNTTILRARDTVLAIGRGFPPNEALRLVEDDIILRIIDLREIFGKSERDISRMKGRVIGSEGKARRTIEEMTKTRMSIYGHTIALIGRYENVADAGEAIEVLLKGKQHATMYRLLRRLKSEAKKREKIELWEKTTP